MEDKTRVLESVTIMRATLERTEDMLRHNVSAALTAGASWTEIGAALGISKQTAHARYGKDQPSKKSDAKVAGDSPKPSKKSDAPAPAPKKTSIPGITVGPPHVKEWPKEPDPRPEFVLRSPGTIDGVAQPGTGKGPHQCPYCGSTNHKSGNPDTIRAYLNCTPTKYDPQDIADHLNTTGLSK